MKKKLLSLSLMTFALIGKAQDCTDLIISEYVEGTSNNKALEFYNTSSSPISLANYRVIRWDNGSQISDQSPEGIMQLPTNITLQPYQTYVIAINLTDPNGTGQTAPIDAALQAKADTLLCNSCASGTGNSRVMCFNGDDALELQKNVGGNWNSIDIFACKGERPTNGTGTFSPTAGWTILAPFSSIPATYDSGTQGPYFKQYWSQDKTLKRKNTIKKGVTVNPGPETFNASVQWDSLSVNSFSGLGAHSCDCQLVGVKELNKSFAFVIFPNPAKSSISLKSENLIDQVVIYNAFGQEVKASKLNKGMSQTIIDISSLSKGIYSVRVIDNKNITSVRKLIIE